MKGKQPRQFKMNYGKPKGKRQFKESKSITDLKDKLYKAKGKVPVIVTIFRDNLKKAKNSNSSIKDTVKLALSEKYKTVFAALLSIQEQLQSTAVPDLFYL